MADRFQNLATGMTSSATRHATITPSDSVAITNKPRALYCNTAGTVVIVDEAGTALSYTVTAGQVIPFRGVRVNATGTTATVYGWD